jgi:hypothetical protein
MSFVSHFDGDIIGEPYLHAYSTLPSNGEYAQMKLGQRGSPTTPSCVRTSLDVNSCPIRLEYFSLLGWARDFF